MDKPRPISEWDPTHNYGTKALIFLPNASPDGGEWVAATWGGGGWRENYAGELVVGEEPTHYIPLPPAPTI